MSSEKENAITAKEVIERFVSDFTPVDEFTYEVFADSERDLNFVMNALTGSFEFDDERLDMAGVIGYRLYLPRPKEYLQRRYGERHQPNIIAGRRT